MSTETKQTNHPEHTSSRAKKTTSKDAELLPTPPERRATTSEETAAQFRKMADQHHPAPPPDWRKSPHYATYSRLTGDLMTALENRDKKVVATHQQEIIDACAEMIASGGHDDDVNAIIRAAIRHKWRGKV